MVGKSAYFRAMMLWNRSFAFKLWFCCSILIRCWMHFWKNIKLKILFSGVDEYIRISLKHKSDFRPMQDSGWVGRSWYERCLHKKMWQRMYSSFKFENMNYMKIWRCNNKIIFGNFSGRLLSDSIHLICKCTLCSILTLCFLKPAFEKMLTDIQLYKLGKSKGILYPKLRYLRHWP